MGRGRNMTLTVISAGLQTSIQGAPYRGMRASAIPASGAVDPLSLALANRLVGKASGALAIEMTMTDAKFRADTDMWIAVTGAARQLRINDTSVPTHTRHKVHSGDSIAVPASNAGVRSYLSLSHDIDVPQILGSGSTCFSGRFGGLDGRALKNGDILPLKTAAIEEVQTITPPELRPIFSNAFLLRYTMGPEHGWLTHSSADMLHTARWSASPRMDRMGIALGGGMLELAKNDNLTSGAVFPGTIQCPPGGQPFLLGVDGQTSGGYPRIAQIIRADRHLIGQIRPGDNITLVHKDAAQAQQIYRQKMDFWRQYVPDIRLD